MFKIIKEAAGPAIFCKGLLRYRQGRFEESRELILKAGRWMAELKSDALYNAGLLLVQSKLGAERESSKYNAALESLMEARYRDTVDYSVIVRDLRNKLVDTT